MHTASTDLLVVGIFSGPGKDKHKSKKIVST